MRSCGTKLLFQSERRRLPVLLPELSAPSGRQHRRVREPEPPKGLAGA